MSSPREAFYDILQADSNVTDEISTRAFINYAPSATTKPFIVFRCDMIDETYTKDKSSSVDTWLVEVDIYHNDLASAETLGGLVTTAFEGYSGTINGNVVQGCKMVRQDQDEDVEQYPVWTQDYELRLER